MDFSDNIKEKLRKIYRLAEQGVEGEREAAKTQLQALMDKYSLTLEDIVEDERKAYVFQMPKSKDERLIFWQVMFAYLNKTDLSYGRSGLEVWLKLTKTEYIDIKSMQDFYLSEYRKDKREHMEIFAEAFAVKNHLFCDDGEKDSMDAETFTPEQLKRSLERLNMAKSMERKQYHRQIE